MAADPGPSPPPADPPDATLVARALGGDASAFRELVLRHQVRVYQIVHPMLRDHTDADDVTHNGLNEIGRLLSGVLDLDTLLESIYKATRRLVDAPGFYIAFYDEADDEFELAYIVEEGIPQPSGDRWKANIGLAGVIARERRPIAADDYNAECLRRGVQPRPFAGTLPSRA